MDILIRGKETLAGTLLKVKFNTDNKTYNVGKYNVSGGDMLIQVASNKEVRDAIHSLEAQNYKLDSNYE